MQKLPAVGAFENVDCQAELSLKLVIQPLHEQKREVLMPDAADNGVLQRMRERTMPDIVKQNRNQGRLLFRSRDTDSLASESLYGIIHKVQSTQTMLEPAVICSRVNKACKAKLPYIPEALNPWVLYDVID